MKPINQLISGAARAIMADNQQIRQLLTPVIPAEALKNVQFFRVEGGRLRITVSSAAWITRLRFIERQITLTLREHGVDAHTVSFHVAPTASLPAQRASASKSISDDNIRTAPVTRSRQQAIDSIESIAKQLNNENAPDQNDRLFQALNTLAQRLRMLPK